MNRGINWLIMNWRRFNGELICLEKREVLCLLTIQKCFILHIIVQVSVKMGKRESVNERFGEVLLLCIITSACIL